jgi:hypothetical protein
VKNVPFYGFHQVYVPLSQAALSAYRFLLSSGCSRLIRDCIFQATLCNPYIAFSIANFIDGPVYDTAKPLKISLSAGHGIGDPAYQLKGLIHVETIEIHSPKHGPQLTFQLPIKLLFIFQRDVNRGVTRYIELLFHHDKEIMVIKTQLYLADSIEQIE